MKIVQFFGAALAVTMLGGAVVPAHAALVTTPPAITASHPANADAQQAMAQSAFSRTQTTAATPRTFGQPKKLQFANFGQWDESASEN